MIKTLEELSLSKGEYGGGFSAVDYYDDAPRYIRITDITENGKLKDKIKAPSGKSSDWEKYQLRDGDILFARSGATVGKTFLYSKEDGNCIYAGYLIRFQPNQKIAFPKHIYYYTKTPNYNAWVANKQNVVAQPNINARQYGKELKIPLPPLPTQKKIAAILDEADHLRQLNQQVLDKYDALSQSVFLEMFGDPVVNSMGWEKKYIKKLGTVTTGNTPPRKNENNYGDFIEWIKTNNVNTPNLHLTQAEEYLSEEGLKLGRFVDSGAILITCIAGSRKVIGNAAIANRKVAFNQQINAFSPQNNNSLFWYYHFKVSKSYVQSFSTNSMKGMISKGKFEQMEFICPPVEIQEQFEKSAQSIEAQKSQAQAALAKSEDLFNSLLQRAFNGELVKE